VLRDAKILSLMNESNGTGTETDHNEHMSLILLDRGDRRYFFRPKVTNVFNAEGKLYSVVTILQDVTQFKELDRMKSDFIATLSHEFKTPLTSMNMSVDLLNQELLGPLNMRQKELINSTKEDTQRLTKLARELLQLSKLESGKQEFKNEELNVRALVESTVKPLRMQFEEKHVNLAIDISDNATSLVADEQQLSWVITNLVTNALKYTKSGGSVTVRAMQNETALQLEVEDTGEGIAPENLKKIFDKFVQVKSASLSTPGSVGLGLAIAKEIVESYGGKIWAESEIEKGSKFVFVIPLQRIASLEQSITTIR
jgi:signal transduction histidine kinase